MGDMGRLIVGVILIIVGINALLGLNLWEYFWPGLLIVLGAWILLGKPGDNHHHFHQAEVLEEGKNHFSYSATFQGLDKRIVTDDFRGGRVDSTFGGVNLDLRDAKIKSKDPVTLKVDVTLGGVKIMVPKTWRVENDIHTVAAGIHDTTVNPADKDKTGTLRIVGNATLGGIEITN